MCDAGNIPFNVEDILTEPFRPGKLPSKVRKPYPAQGTENSGVVSFGETWSEFSITEIIRYHRNI